MVPIKYEIGPATEQFGTRLIIDVHGDVIAEVPMLLNSKLSLDERCAERDRRAHMIVNALNNQESAKSPMCGTYLPFLPLPFDNQTTRWRFRCASASF
jgi:hypothetical protein